MNSQPGLIANFSRLASGKRCLILFGITTAVYLWMLFVTIPQVQRHVPEIPLFDMSPWGYDYQKAVTLLKTLGEEGRNAYRFPQLALDFVYPGLFAVTYAMILTWVLRKRVRSGSKVLWVAVLPVVAGLFDYLENILILRMLSVFPTVSEWLVAVSSAFTILKSVFTTATLSLVFVGFIVLLKPVRVPHK